MQECYLCGEQFYEDDMASYHCCRECAKKHATSEIVLKYIIDKNLLVEFFVEFVMDSLVKAASATLLELCQREFNSFPEDEKNRLLMEYLESDFSDFCDWLEVHHGEV